MNQDVKHHGPSKLLCAPVDIENDYGIKQSTQAVWRNTNRWGWRDLAIKVGRNVRYRRADIDAWLQQRKGLPTSRHSEPKGAE